MSDVRDFPSQSTILAEIAAIHALAERMRVLERGPICTLCRPGDPCWFHRSHDMRRTDEMVQP